MSSRFSPILTPSFPTTTLFAPLFTNSWQIHSETHLLNPQRPSYLIRPTPVWVDWITVYDARFILQLGVGFTFDPLCKNYFKSLLILTYYIPFRFTISLNIKQNISKSSYYDEQNIFLHWNHYDNQNIYMHTNHVISSSIFILNHKFLPFTFHQFTLLYF